MDYRKISQCAVTSILTISLFACGGGSGPGGSDAVSNGSGSAGGSAVIITNPTDFAEMATTDKSVIVAGTASSGVGIAEVSWTSSGGEQGIASGTEFWQTGGIELNVGDNIISVSARDRNGATSSDSIMVRRESGEAGSVSLAWSAPTERSDGSPLTNLAGYQIHYGRMSGIYDFLIDIANPGIVSYVVENLDAGIWYFTLTSYDTAGIDSEYSAEVAITPE